MVINNNTKKIVLIILASIFFGLVLLITGNFNNDSMLTSTVLFATLLAVLWYMIETNIIQQNTKIQIELSRTTLGVELTLKFDDHFSSDDFVDARRTSASKVLEAINTTLNFRDEVTRVLIDDYGEIEEILDFFEQIGYLVRKGILDKKFVWHTFSYWFFRYWHLTKGYIDVRGKNSSVYKDLAFLNESMIEIEKEESPYPDTEICPSDDELKRFLEEEAL